MINKDYYSLDSLEMEQILNLVMSRFKDKATNLILCNLKNLMFIVTIINKRLIWTK